MNNAVNATHNACCSPRKIRRHETVHKIHVNECGFVMKNCTDVSKIRDIFIKIYDTMRRSKFEVGL